MSNSTNQTKYFLEGCPLGSTYKYICGDTSSEIYPWYRHWKDVAEMKAYTVTRIRIRWAKNSYNVSESPYPYFNYGEDELMEFPGMVYHCHILPHEENMMMRPIMMQPSDAYLSLTANLTSSASSCMMGGSWRENEKCVNRALGC